MFKQKIQQKFLFFILSLAAPLSAFAQNQLTDEHKKQLGISYPVQYTHEYTDRAGAHLLVLTAQPKADTAHSNLKALCLQNKAGKWVKEWEANDLLMGEEESIFYRNGLVRVQDLDKDGLAEPILVYATTGPNGTDDGRLKVIVYYKGAKSAIRHQNGVLDFERNTQIDNTFYKLPTSVQKGVQYVMVQAGKQDLTIFPSNWQESMSKKAIKIKN
ncbi:hypothetical protein SAMN05421780_101341 [Flexibacter flexilis DSM 6793]|uniref:Uncharacterized protein n=1 Tax=Flexibacter flexilis DSM 6793 TaxID=927664 RepID=A0A1I1DMZ0_9BACT|nr:hypothetical protein [Flexibacter flexilis]SFB76261.1 hypothetical protein SAMN05421780_101341 [Flexibacter flexilis DSM 6793]